MARKLRNTSSSEITAIYTYGEKIAPNKVIWLRDEDATLATDSGKFTVVPDDTTHDRDLREGTPLSGEYLSEQDEAALDRFLAKGVFPGVGGGAVGSVESLDKAYHPSFGSTYLPAIQFRGPTDTANSLGRIGIIINAANNSEASNRFAASDADIVSPINGASLTGHPDFAGPYANAIRTLHIAVLGLTAPYTLATGSPVLSVGPQMIKLTFDELFNVTALSIMEGPPTNFANTPGTGSARVVTISGMAE